MSFAADGGIPAGPLLAEDARALTRLLRRSLGRGFRLVVIEVATPRIRTRVLEWLRLELEPVDGLLHELDVGSLAGENLWSELGEHLGHGDMDPERLVLALHGFQAAARGQPDEQSGLFRQLNVQRDLFVRDLGCFWILLINPYGSRKLQDIAPDFCDFASLWIRAPGSAAPADSLPIAVPMSAQYRMTSLADDRGEAGAELLRRAKEAIVAGRYVQARDLLTRIELADDATREERGYELRLRGELELRRGNLDAAHDAAERAVAWSLSHGPQALPATSSALHLLGSVLEAQGHYERARTALERSLELVREHHGPPAQVAAVTHELARVHAALGNLLEARSLLDRAMNIGKRSPTATAATLHELAAVRFQQGDLSGARRALEQTLEIERRTFGTEQHPDVATTLHSLAVILHAQGELNAARINLERALEIYADVLGTELHPNVAATLAEFASILRKQGDIDGARREFDRALAIQVSVFGTQSHPSVAATLSELAEVLRARGDLEGARERLEQALAIYVEVFGTDDHPNVAKVLHALAVLLDDAGEPTEAAAMYERALDIDNRTLGPDHHSTCETEVALARLLLANGDSERGEALLRHARPILANLFGSTNEWVKRADALLAACAFEPER